VYEEFIDIFDFQEFDYNPIDIIKIGHLFEIKNYNLKAVDFQAFGTFI